MSERLRFGSVAAAVLAVGFLVYLSPGEARGPQARQPPGRSEVVFIGANHNLSFLHPGFSPAHLRALLSKIGPVAVCVEVPLDWPQSLGIPTFPQEQYAAMTWAKQVGVPMYGVNWTTPSVKALPPIERMTELEPAEAGDRFERFRSSHRATILWAADRAFGEVAEDLESFQRTQLGTPLDKYPDEGIAAERDDRIAQNIQAVAAKHPGRPIAVVFGGGHYLPLKKRLEARGIRIVSALKYFPLESERIQASWQSDDAVVLLGTNLDDWRTIASPQSRNHQRTKELLDRLARERPNAIVTRYYRARWRMLLGDLEAARPELKRIADEGTATVSPYLADARWSWPPLRAYEQRARFYLAVSHDLAGDRQEAVSHYRTLLTMPEDQLVVPALIGGRRVDLRPYVESLLRTPFRGGIFEAYRAFLAMGR
jgi:hypothetical protein